jgi:hypothetical protein
MAVLDSGEDGMATVAGYYDLGTGAVGLLS